MPKSVSAFVEIFAGMVRAGPGCRKYGDPYDFAVSFVGNAGVAEIKGLVSTNGNVNPEYAKVVLRVLKDLGLKPTWRRMKTPKLETSEDSAFRDLVETKKELADAEVEEAFPAAPTGKYPPAAGKKNKKNRMPPIRAVHRNTKVAKTRCRHADRYNGVRRPRCSVGGRICGTCQAKWDATQASRKKTA